MLDLKKTRPKYLPYTENPLDPKTHMRNQKYERKYKMPTITMKMIRWLLRADKIHCKKKNCVKEKERYFTVTKVLICQDSITIINVYALKKAKNT